MGYENVLLIGGPWDGKWFPVEKNRWTLVIIESIDPTRKDKKYYIPSLEELDKKHELDERELLCNIEKHIYYRERLLNGSTKEEYFVFKHGEVEDIIRHLIEGYVGVEGK